MFRTILAVQQRAADYLRPELVTEARSFEEAKEMVRNFHLQLKEVHSIGWDITITPDGPCIIEGNDNWEISALQVTNHGMKKEFEQYMK